jgi:hypothetical protein
MPDRVMITLGQALLEQGLSAAEVATALDLPETAVKDLGHWRTPGAFSRAEAARYRDLLRLAAWRLGYWRPGPDGRLELLAAEQRTLARLERAASYRGRVAQGTVPPDLLS